jgi:hypothetical protein
MQPFILEEFASIFVPKFDIHPCDDLFVLIIMCKLISTVPLSSLFQIDAIFHGQTAPTPL